MPGATVVTSECPRCGTTIVGKSSCCGRGGAWFGKCGNKLNPEFDHTWFEGFQACSSSAALNAGHSEPDGSQEIQAQETSQITVHGEAGVYDSDTERYASSQVYAKLAHHVGCAAVVLVALFA